MGLLLDNVIDNAIRYSDGTPWLGIRAAPSNGVVRVAISDSGMGIAPDEIDHVVRKFFRGRRAGSGGSGLGLAIASRIVRDHGGTLDIDSALGAAPPSALRCRGEDGTGAQSRMKKPHPRCRRRCRAARVLRDNLASKGSRSSAPPTRGRPSSGRSSSCPTWSCWT